MPTLSYDAFWNLLAEHIRTAFACRVDPGTITIYTDADEPDGQAWTIHSDAVICRNCSGRPQQITNEVRAVYQKHGLRLDPTLDSDLAQLTRQAIRHARPHDDHAPLLGNVGTIANLRVWVQRMPVHQLRNLAVLTAWHLFGDLNDEDDPYIDTDRDPDDTDVARLHELWQDACTRGPATATNTLAVVEDLGAPFPPEDVPYCRGQVCPGAGALGNEAELTCDVCDQPMVVNQDGTTHHLQPSGHGPDATGVGAVDHDADADHVACNKEHADQ